MNLLLLYNGHNDSSSANGICVKNIAQEFLRQGHRVWIIWATKYPHKNGYEKDGCICYDVKESWYYGFNERVLVKNKKIDYIIHRVLGLVRLLYVFPLFPNVSPLVYKRCSRLALKIVLENSIDVVVGFYMPFEAIKVAVNIKKTFGRNIQVVNYHLDLLTSPANENRYIINYKKWRIKRFLSQEVTIVNKLLLPESAMGLLKGESIHYVDFPLFLPNPPIIANDYKYSDDVINVAYIGSLDSRNRNPNYVLEVISRVNYSRQKKVLVNIWGIVADSETWSVLSKYDNVVYHGVVENTYVHYLLSGCDILLNVSNAVTFQMIPSKIFQLFSMHKPVINVVKHQEDYSLRYFDYYPVVSLVKEYENDINKDVLRVNSMIDNLPSYVEFEESIYKKSTPEYICNVILK